MVGALKCQQIAIVGNDAHHAVAIHIAHHSRKRQILDSGVLLRHTIAGEKYDGFAKFEVVLDVGIGSAHHLHSQLVERIIVALGDLQRIPSIATLYLPHHSHLFGLFAEGFFLGLILHLE